MPKFRVRYARRTYIELYLEVEASTKESAQHLATRLLESGDDDLIEDTPSMKFKQETTPTGEIDEIEE